MSKSKKRRFYGPVTVIERGQIIIPAIASYPITTLNAYKAVSAEWNDGLRGNFLWSGANLVENAPHISGKRSALNRHAARW